MSALPDVPMTVDAFIPWAMAQPRGRYELVDGVVVAMAPERAAHVEAKAAAARALGDAAAAAGLPCKAYVDGLGVRIDETTMFEPDALMRYGPPLPGEAVEIDDPVVVVEVLSPSTQRRDHGLKLEGYFRLPACAHYLIVNPETRAVIHHRRKPDAAEIATLILREPEALTLDPPGLTVGVAAMLPTA